MLKLTNNSAVCDGLLHSVTTTRTNPLPCVGSLPAWHQTMPRSQGKPSHTVTFERSTDSAAGLAATSFGRVLLHLACLLRDHRLRWHWAGIVRELRDWPSNFETHPIL